MKRFALTVKHQGKTKRIPKAGLPDNWRERIEGRLRMHYARPKGSPVGMSSGLKMSPPTLGSLTPALEPYGAADSFRCKRWIAAQERYLSKALRILETNEAKTAACWLVAAAEAANGGLVVQPDRTDDRPTSVLGFLTYEIDAIAQLASDENEEGGLKKTAKNRKQEIAEISSMLKRTASALEYLAFDIDEIAELVSDGADSAEQVATFMKISQNHGLILSVDEAERAFSIYKGLTPSEEPRSEEVEATFGKCVQVTARGLAVYKWIAGMQDLLPRNPGPKGRPPRRTDHAIKQLTDANLKICANPVYDATAALLNAAFPKGKPWTSHSVRTRYSQIS